MIVVTGATGLLGSQIVDRLLERVPPEHVGVSVRDTDKAADLAACGVRVRRGDFSEPATLRHSFEDAAQVFVVSANEFDPTVYAAYHRTAFAAARAAGAGRVLYTSHQAASKDSLFPAEPLHAAVEHRLITEGGAFTALRNGFYANTVTAILIRNAVESGTIAMPADGPVSWTAHADLAEAAAVVLADEGRIDGVSPPLTAPDLLDLDDIAGILSVVTGQRITRTVVDDDEWLADAVAAGVPTAGADYLLGMFRAARRGEFAVTDPALEKLIERPATTVRSLIEAAVPGVK